MWLLLCLSTLSLLAGTIHAHTTDATCTADRGWTSNSLQQSPCLVASYLFEACAPNVVNIPAQPNQQRYPSPGENGLPANKCSCSSVAYSVLAACSYCQGQLYEKWSTWKTNCTPAETFVDQWPLPVPIGTAIPAWAFDNPTSLDGWDPTQAQLLADSGATDTFPASTTSTSAPATTVTEATQTSTADTNTTSSPADTGHHSSTPVGAIVGGVVGGLVALGIGAIGVALIVRYTRGRGDDDDGPPRPVRPSTTRLGSSGSMTSRWVKSGGQIFSRSPPPVMEMHDQGQVTAYPLPRMPPSTDAGTISSGRVPVGLNMNHHVPEV
ncbi:hypothetical protein EXIGLDRAFT_404105 [Exidia glandulosa HHB12029]|uniref:Transmembrane protein n=1 Tax=Exidia glandulosa HHB12029 TaxID=1314781 RepID=A0A165KS61_EXIGL|nr:hypothetical protein EXIGLDRAFT_404105 [Exidia glandulosa HHB12029]